MLHLIAPKTMLACEKKWFEESGVPSIEVMERAATCLAESVLRRYGDRCRVYIACGPGGNGGDGYACARILTTHAGMECVIIRSAPAASPDCKLNAERASECGIRIEDTDALTALTPPEIWIDCLYGTGLSREPEGASAAIIHRILRDRIRGTKVIACDIPSGLDGQTGKAYDACVLADVTCALQFAKYGHFLNDGIDICGEIDIPDIGFPESAFPGDLPIVIDPDDLHGFFKPRKRNIHKNSCGHLLIIAGSFGMAGAASMAAMSALRSGVGLVTVACPASIVPILQTLAPCAMCIPLAETDGAINVDAFPAIKQAMKGKTAIAIGCGLTRRAAPEVIRAVLQSDLPAVIDADAINLISEHRELLNLLDQRHILTPHPGEAARLIGRPVTDPVNDSAVLAEFGGTVILKGAVRVIRSKDTCMLSTTGGCGMARGGSGDILTGIIGALLAERSDRSYAETAVCACELHGAAGALAQEKYGSRAMNARDIIEFLPEAFKRYAE